LSSSWVDRGPCALQQRAADAQYRQAPPIVKACLWPEFLPQNFGDL